MNPPSDDLPAKAAGAIHLEEAYTYYATRILTNTYGYGPDMKIGAGLRLHFVAPTDGYIRTVNLGRLTVRCATAPDVKEYVLRGFEDLTDETDRNARRLTRNLERGFISRLRDGYLIAWGRENSPLRDWSEIPRSAWRTLRPAQLHSGFVKGPGGFQLFDVRVKPAPPPRRSRPPKIGRPTSNDVVKDEFDRRLAAGLVGKVLRVEAKHLSKWLEQKHPNETQLKWQTIASHIRKPFNDWKARLSNDAS